MILVYFFIIINFEVKILSCFSVLIEHFDDYFNDDILYFLCYKLFIFD